METRDVVIEAAGYLKKYKRRLDRRTYVDAKELERLRKQDEFEERK